MTPLRLLLIAFCGALLTACATVGPPTTRAPGSIEKRLSLRVTPATAPASGDSFVVLYSGDGGWSGGTQDISDDLAAAGVPTVGFDSLHYFWKTRTPAQAAAELAELVDHYGALWAKSHVVLSGYSFGASALPLIARELPAEIRAKVRALIMIAPRDYVEMVVRPNSWFDIKGPHTEPLEPVLASTTWPKVICIYGVKDRIAACPKLTLPGVEIDSLPVGHRFGAQHGRIAEIIEGATAPRADK